LVRVRALVRRGQHQHDPILEIADLRVDTTARRTWRGGTELDLAPRE